jgi:hypothetical protein
VALQLVVYWRGDVRVHGGEELPPALEEAHVEPEALQVLRHLQADVAPSRDHRALRAMLAEVVLDRDRVFHHVKVEDAREVEPGQGEPGRGGAGGDQEPVVPLLGLSPVAAYPHGSALGVDSSHLVVEKDLDAAPPELLDGAGDEAPSVPDHPADEVRHAALAVGGEAALVVGDDLEVRIGPARLGGRAHAGRVGADDHEPFAPLTDSRPVLRADAHQPISEPNARQAK